MIFRGLQPPLSQKDLLDLLRLANDASDYEVRVMAKQLACGALMPAPATAPKREDTIPRAMDEFKFYTLARQYVDLLSHSQGLKPTGWSQEDHTREHLNRMRLLNEMREALSGAPTE